MGMSMGWRWAYVHGNSVSSINFVGICYTTYIEQAALLAMLFLDIILVMLYLFRTHRGESCKRTECLVLKACYSLIYPSPPSFAPSAGLLVRPSPMSFTALPWPSEAPGLSLRHKISPCAGASLLRLHLRRRSLFTPTELASNLHVATSRS
jgi:hypothetical protein